MNKKTRAHKRILKDKELKLKRQKELLNNYKYDSIFTYTNFVDKISDCMKGVSWKASVQNYYINCLIKTYTDYSIIKNHKLPIPVSDKEIVIFERGKARIITPIHIKDRVIQKVLCDYALVPVLSNTLIYDNGASLKGKGVMFSRTRLELHLKHAIKKYGDNFYIMIFDFKDFFNSIPHRTCRRILRRYFNEDVVSITMQIIKSPLRIKIKRIKGVEKKKYLLNELDNDNLCGICLGSQVSQIMALVIANEMDHYIKDKLMVKEYDRYMDDGVIMAKTKDELRAIYNGMKEICTKLGLNFNQKKTHIVNSHNGFTFLKVKYFVTKTGGIISRLTHKGIVRMRRKLKKLKAKLDNGAITINNVYDSFRSWFEHSKVANHKYKTVKTMAGLYTTLFGDFKITKKGENDVLQIVEREDDIWRHYRDKLQAIPA